MVLCFRESVLALFGKVITPNMENLTGLQRNCKANPSNFLTVEKFR